MKRLIPLLVVPALALAPGTALGHGKSKTKVYKLSWLRNLLW